MSEHHSQIQQDNRLKLPKIPKLPIRKSLKIILVGLFIGIGLFVLGYRVLNTISIKGVVNAPILLIQAPIDGTITEDLLEAGKTLLPGTVIYKIDNDRLDTSNLHHINAELQLSIARWKGLQSKELGYLETKKDLEVRLKAHLQQNSAYLKSKTAEIQHQLSKAKEALLQADRDQDRQTKLTEQGADSKRSLEAAQLQQVQAGQEVESLTAALTRAKTEETAGGLGILLDGYSGAPYSRQRLDEVMLKLTETKADLLKETNEITALTRQLGEEKILMDKKQGATVKAPSLALVQSARATKGTYVTKGTVLCELIDCSKSYVEATIPEKQFDSIKLGDPAKIYLYGNSKPIDGVVISVRGAGAYNASNPEQFAAKILKTTPDSMIVSVAIKDKDLLDTFGSYNQVGRTARVKIHKK